MIGGMNHLNPADAAYLAGLVDADGTVTLSRKHRSESRHLAVSISNTDRDLLDFVMSIRIRGRRRTTL